MRFRLLACLSLLAAAPAAAETVVVHAGRLITDASKPASGPSTITIVDGRITAVAAGLTPVPAGARLVDLSGKTVLPGLIDMHVHLSGDPGGDFRDETVDPNEWATLVGAKNARITALAGFTTVRDLGSPPLVGFALRRATAEGIVPGPADPVLRAGHLDHRRPWRRLGLPSRGDPGARRRQYLHRRRSNAPRGSANSPAPAPTSSRSPRPAESSRSRRAASASISPTPR